MRQIKNSILTIIDMQEGFRCKEVEQIIPVIDQLCKSFTGTRVFPAFYNKQGSLFQTQLHWKRFQTPEDVKIVKELDEHAVTIIPHSGYTVYNKELQYEMASRNVKEVYLCGVFTDVCIIKTAMDLFDAEVEVFVVSDACATPHGREIHNVVLKSLNQILGSDHVIMSKECVNKNK